VPDVRRAAEVLGFSAQTSLAEGLPRTIAWFQQAWPRRQLAPDWGRVVDLVPDKVGSTTAQRG